MFTWENAWNVLRPLIKMGLILLIGHFIIVYIMRIVKKAFHRSKMDHSLAEFLSKSTNIVLHIFVILSALNSVGVSTNGILAALSAATVAVAVALKDSLNNVAGGILLLLSPRVYIAAGGDEGTVVRVDLLHTTVRTIDNKMVSIPNGALLNSHIINYTREPRRRVDITFSVPYEANIEKAKQIICGVLLAHPLVLKEPEEPMARVMRYQDSAVEVITRSWCNTPDYWKVYFDLTEQVRDALEKNGITIPYNQFDVHIKESEK